MTILDLALMYNIHKICINGQIKDVRQFDKNPFNVIPQKWEIMKKSIYNEPILFCW